mmetsp:Transcript_12952/g.20774  ORF Transcript_12952/g.20774 Transcript_12952/m.20774 type:complete len:122 (+) Transcript_12952:1156-1521(+)
MLTLLLLLLSPSHFSIRMTNIIIIILKSQPTRITAVMVVVMQVWSHGGFMPGVRSHIYIWPRGKGITTSGQKNGGDKNVGGQKDSSSASNEPTMMGAIFLSNGQGSYLELAELFEEIVRNS